MFAARIANHTRHTTERFADAHLHDLSQAGKYPYRQPGFVMNLNSWTESKKFILCFCQIKSDSLDAAKLEALQSLTFKPMSHSAGLCAERGPAFADRQARRQP